MLSRRMPVFVLDLLFSLVIACLVLAACAQPAYAYVDPSVMTYTIQALAGVAVALSAVFGVLWRRTRKKLLRVLNIDENARKEVEPDVHRVDASGEVIFASGEEVGSTAQAKRAPLDKCSDGPMRLSWPRRFALALVVSAFLAYTVGVVAPYEIVSGGSDSLIFGLSDVWAPLAVFALVAALAVALVVSLFRGRVFNVALALVAALGICAYIQAMFLNSALPAADGSAVVWGDYTAITVISAVVWLAIGAGAVVLCLRREKLFRSIAVVACVALVVVQSVGVASLWLSPQTVSADTQSGVRAEDLRVTEEGLFDVSSKNNVIVFVLDTFDSADLIRLTEAHPDMLDELTGFTQFPDSAGSMIPTAYAIPYLLTGEFPRQDDTFSQFRQEQYQRSSFVDDISDKGYSIGIYSDSIGEGTEYVADKTVNIHPLGESSVDNVQAVLTLGKCALYRDLPWVLKPPFWFYTDEINAKVNSKVNSGYGDIPYTMNDLDYYDKLASGKLSVADDGSQGAFRFIHLQGAHGPYVMDEHARPAGSEGSSLDQQCLGSFEIVDEYIRQMKELGVYDNSTIVITADHGYWGLVMDLTSATSPVLLVKPSDERGGNSNAPCRVSTVPTGHVDYPATIIDAVGGDSSKYGSTVFEVPDADRQRRYFMTANDGKHSVAIKELIIDGNVLDFSNWHLTDNEWDCEL